MIFLQHPAKESIQNFISWEIYIYCKLFNIWLTWLQFFFFLFSSFYTLEILTLYIIKVFDLQLIVMLFSYSWTFDKKHTFWVTYTLMHNFFFFKIRTLLHCLFTLVFAQQTIFTHIHSPRPLVPNILYFCKTHQILQAHQPPSCSLLCPPIELQVYQESDEFAPKVIFQCHLMSFYM